jgi:hypothetical protein
VGARAAAGSEKRTEKRHANAEKRRRDRQRDTSE